MPLFVPEFLTTCFGWFGLCGTGRSVIILVGVRQVIGVGTGFAVAPKANLLLM